MKKYSSVCSLPLLLLFSTDSEGAKDSEAEEGESKNHQIPPKKSKSADSGSSAEIIEHSVDTAKCSSDNSTSVQSEHDNLSIQAEQFESSSCLEIVPPEDRKAASEKNEGESIESSGDHDSKRGEESEEGILVNVDEKKTTAPDVADGLKNEDDSEAEERPTARGTRLRGRSSLPPSDLKARKDLPEGRLTRSSRDMTPEGRITRRSAENVDACKVRETEKSAKKKDQIPPGRLTRRSDCAGSREGRSAARSQSDSRKGTNIEAAKESVETRTTRSTGEPKSKGGKETAKLKKLQDSVDTKSPKDEASELRGRKTSLGSLDGFANQKRDGSLDVMVTRRRFNSPGRLNNSSADFSESDHDKDIDYADPKKTSALQSRIIEDGFMKSPPDGNMEGRITRRLQESMTEGRNTRSSKECSVEVRSITRQENIVEGRSTRSSQDVSNDVRSTRSSQETSWEGRATRSCRENAADGRSTRSSQETSVEGRSTRSSHDNAAEGRSSRSRLDSPRPKRSVAVDVQNKW